MKTLQELSKELDFTYAAQYFEYMIESYINGQKKQCKELYYAMSSEDQKKFINWFSREENCTMDLDECFNFYKNLKK